MKRIFLGIVLGLTLAATGWSQERQIRGWLTYEDYTPAGTFVGTKPIRWVTVTIKHGSTVLSTAQTGHDGYFSRWLPASSLPLGHALRIEFKSVNYAANVLLDLDWEDDRLTWSRDITIPSGTGAIDMSKVVKQGDFSVHFSIQEAITYGRMYADANRGGSDDVTQCDVQYPDADWSNYSFSWDEITLSGMPAFGYGGSTEHGWADETVLHEYGHHLQYHISDIDAGGEKHSSCDDFGYSFAWLEGWPTYFAKAVATQYPAGVEVTKDIEPIPMCGSPSTEAVTRSCLWDLHDDANEGHDFVDGARLAGGVSLRRILFEIFDDEMDNSGPYPFLDSSQTDLLGFHGAYVSRNPYVGSHAELDSILFAHNVNPHAKADYSALSLSASATSVPSGGTVRLTLRSSLGGYNYPDEPMRLRVFLVNTFTSGVVEVGTWAVKPFQAVFTFTARMPTILQAGSYTLNVEIDPTKRIAESNEANNRASTPISVTSLAIVPPAPN